MKDSVLKKRSNGVTTSHPVELEESKEEEQFMNTCHALRMINRGLTKIFYNLGYSVGQHPLLYTIIPFIISLVLTTGVYFITYEENPFVLFVPYNAPFNKEQKIVEAHFPMNYSEYYNPSRFTRHEGHSRVIVTARDEGSIFRPELWPEIMELDERIREVTMTDDDGNIYNYTNICSKWRGYCIENLALNLNEIIYEIANGTTVISYPIMVFPFLVPQLMGGVEINKTGGSIDDAKSIVLGYFIQAQTPEKLKIATVWENNMLNLLHGVNYEQIRVSYYTSRSLGDELTKKMDSSLPFIPLTVVIMVASVIGLLWMTDCIRCKPLVGVVGVISSGMAAGSAFGFLIYCGATYARLNVIALFLVLGIGVDDIFVAIAAWQKTSVTDSVPKRLAYTYADAAVSVTITSVTNALAFAVGTSTPTVIVSSFCLYCGVTIIFAYFFFITFCGGFLALAGYAEKQGRHALFLVKVKPAPENSSVIVKKFYSIFCSSPMMKKDYNNDSLKPHIVSSFFRDRVGSMLLNNNVKFCVLFSFVIYLCGAIYGLSILKEGLYRHRMSRDDSYLVDFSLDDDRYFRHLPYSIQAVTIGNITYSDKETQKKLLKLEKVFEALPYGSDPLYTQSWLRSFNGRLRRRRKWRDNITDEVSFIKVLREKFFANKDNTLALDVKFNEDYTRIVASRVIYQAANVKDVYDDSRMMHTYRIVAAESEFDVTVFHLLFSLFDQHSMMRPLAIQSILIAVVVVVIVALLFIPDICGSIAIAFSIISIAIGVLGYMAFWDVNLDQVSAGSIFMCIGFSVDFSAHITYTYLSSKASTSEAKMRESLFSLGLPILQGGISTILSLVTFLLIPAYGYRTFFKTILLVTIFAAYHSIILIPLFLYTVHDLLRRYRMKREKAKLDSETNDIATMKIERIENGNTKPRSIDEPQIKSELRVKQDNDIDITEICKIVNPEEELKKNEKNDANNATKCENKSIKVETKINGVENEAFESDDL